MEKNRILIVSALLVLVSTIAFAQDKVNVNGIVKDVKGDPVIGASVVEKGTTNGTVTDIQGNFNLNVSSKGILVISSIGYQKQTISVYGKHSFEIALEDDSKTLNEVVVVGYGTQKKANLTGSVTAVTGDQLSKRPVVNAAAMLEAQIPGLRVNQGIGQPGNESVSFRIRGQGTFSSAGSDPLILVNGVPGDISNLDPSIIETVSVLKDAASAAIYGARAANGVILVTTKQGSSNSDGSAHISYRGNIGIYHTTRMYDLVKNSVEYMELANLAKTNSGVSGFYSQDIIDAYKNNVGNVEYPNFDWLGYMFRTATVQNHNLSASGNSGKTTYNVSLNFIDEPGTMRGFNYDQYNSTIDLTTQINKHIKLGTYTSIVYTTRKEPRQGQADAFLSTMSQAPTYMPWLPDDGSGVIKWTKYAYDFEDRNKNMAAIIGTNCMKKYYNYDINAQMWLEVNLLKGLTWYTKAAGRLRSNKSKDWVSGEFPVYNYHTKLQVGTLDTGRLGLEVDDSRRAYYNLYTYLKYDYATPNKDHKFSLMAGYNMEDEKYETLSAYRKYYAFALPVLDSGSTSNWSNGGSEEDWAMMSYFGRFNYNYKDRYLFESNLRYDGTSRLSKDHRWGAFPSFSAGWRLTQEDFIKNLNWNWLDDAKIRGSWGELGNQNIGLYPYQAIISGVSDYPFNKSDVTSGYTQTAYANNNIKWETTTVIDLGTDLQVLNGLNITFDWYNKRTTDILRSAQVSALLGLSAPTVNDGTVQNRGVELSVNYNKLVKNGTFKGLYYNAGAYVDRTRNKLVKFGAEEISGYYLRKEGLPYNQYYALKCIGVFSDASEVTNSPKQFNDNTLPGDLKYEDTNKDGVIDNNDRVPIAGRFPGFEYGISGNASWKGFDVSILGQGVSGKKYYTDNWGIRPFYQGSAPTRDYVNGMWTETHTTGATYPKLYWSDLGGSKNNRPSSFFLKDASYFRLKNFTFGYTLPQSITKKAMISKLRLYFSGDNLLTFTKYKGLDPERDDDGNDAIYPQNKIYSFGINVEF